MKKIQSVFWALCLLWIAVPVVNAQDQIRVDQSIRQFKFRFQPDVLQSEGGNSQFVQGLYEKTPGFPLWLLMDMGGDLLVDEELFKKVKTEKDREGIWIVEANYADSINGYFGLYFGIDSKTGETALKIADAEEDLVLYSGKLMPYKYEKSGSKGKKGAEALQMEKYLDQAVPELNFTVRLKSEIYGPEGFVTVTPDRITTTAPQSINSEEVQTICCERQGDYWFVRFAIGDFAEVLGEDMLLDLVIHASTGQVNYRLGMADRLKINWRSMVDGDIVMPKN